ncbi:caspase family protein [Argonema galeatum]|uniref:nSTAND1 domain-containing NTPase n=1 Tax=Argonema galeatum TaxID=2942762 RepID=UPI0020116AFD|nr:caspase family protein [Argonema galeatum]MCL1464728.1 caspase family protein [Argonema galeatum A003/A1]
MAKYALVIGIAEYKNPLQRLPKTTTDAEAVVQVLKKYGDFQQVIRLPERWNQEKQDYEIAAKAVTGKELGEALRNFLREHAVSDDLLIYFTGHGFKVSDNLGQEKGYLASSDCIIQTDGERIVEIQNGIALDSLNDLIRASNLGSLVLLLDCCHSGYFLERQLVEQSLTAISSRRDYYLITACRGSQEAIAYDFEKHDVFTGALINGLAVENAGKDGQISGDRVFDYISRALKGSKQEPIRMGWGRSITLVTYPKKDIPTVEIAFNTENPYRGLYPFELEQEKYFCGREQAIRALLDRLSSNRFMAVIGPSGCGKSSLVKAGLLPHLKRDRLPGSSQWGIETFTPGKYPLGKLIEILDRQHRENQPFVLFIDQMEEIFTLCEDDAERQSLISLMADEATKSDRITRVIVAIRTDFLDRCAAYPKVANLINRTQPTTYMVTPLSRQELENAIEEPASLHGVKFERGLISQIADDVNDQPGALPLLQYALKELWRVCIEKPDSPEPRLTLKGYKEIGGVKGALENRANLLYQSFSSTDQLFVRQMFMELVQLGEENLVTRRRASREKLEANADSIDQLRRVVGLLADQRLIVTDEDTVEVAHEALLTEWNLLRGWIEENRENIRLSRLLEAECREWQERFKKSDEALLTGAKLAIISEWKEKIQPKLPVEESEFLRRSLEKRDKKIKEELEQQKRITRSLIAVGVLVISILGLGLLAQQLQAKKRESDAIAVVALVSKAQKLFGINKQLDSLIASIEALKLMQAIKSQDVYTINLMASLISKVSELNRFENQNCEFTDVIFAPNGKIIAASDYKNKVVKFWQINGLPMSQVIKEKQKIWSIIFSHDGQTIASAGVGGKINFWDVNGKHKGELKTKGEIYKIRFGSDSQTIVSTNIYDKTVNIWQLRNYNNYYSYNNYKPLSSFNNHRDAVYGLAISPNGELIASSSWDGEIKVWRINSKEIVHTFRHDTPVFSVDFSSNGEFLASGSRGGKVKVWNLKTGQLIKTFTNHTDDIYAVNFSSDSQMLVSASEDKTVKLWDIRKLKLIKTLFGHTDAVNSAVFSPDGKIIASTGKDGTVRIWSVNSPINNADNQDLKALLKSSCSLLKEGYLQNSKNLKQEDRKLCDGV